MPLANQNPMLDPSSPSFNPASIDLMHREDYSQSSPRGFSVATSLADMRELIIQSNHHFVRDVADLERRADANAEDIKMATDTFRRDIQALQSLIYGVQEQINNIQNDDDEKFLQILRAFHANATKKYPPALEDSEGDEEAMAQPHLEHHDGTETSINKPTEQAARFLEAIPKPETAMKVKDPLAHQGPSEDNGQAAMLESVKNASSSKLSDSEGDNSQSTTWVPRAVREMPALREPVSASACESFEWQFITSQLGGKKWSPGYYFNQHPAIGSKGYWVLEADLEPFLPLSPGQHGAKLTVFFNETVTESGEEPDPDDYTNTPVFIRPKGKTEYVYFGQYSQTRYSDKLDYDRVTVTVPKHVRQAQAEQLADPGRPTWVTQALMQSYCPKPKYNGPVPKDGDGEASHKKISEALWAYAEDLALWERDATSIVDTLTTETILKSFENADTSEVPGLRMHWEYMQCVAYDQDLYAKLVRMKHAKVSTPPPDVTKLKEPMAQT